MNTGASQKTPIYEDEESKAEMLSYRPKPKGRPPYNIFSERSKILGEKLQTPYNPKLVRIKLQVKRKSWKCMDVRYTRRLQRERWTDKPFAWSLLIKDGDDRYLPYEHAEMAMLLCGRHLPEVRFTEDGLYVHKPTLYEHFMRFRHFCYEVDKRTSYPKQIWKFPGQKPDPEKMYRTGVSTLIARQFLNPGGGNRWFIPSPTAIRQVWEVIFGEQENESSIAKRLPTLAWYCYEKGRNMEFQSCDWKDDRFALLAEPLGRIYPKFMPRKLTRAEIAALDEAEEIACDAIFAELFKVYRVTDDELIDTTEIPYREDLYIPRK